MTPEKFTHSSPKFRITERANGDLWLESLTSNRGIYFYTGLHKVDTIESARTWVKKYEDQEKAEHLARTIVREHPI